MTNHRTIQPDARKVIVGVDTHKHVHVAVAIDTWGVRLDDRSCAADADGYQQLITWPSVTAASPRSASRAPAATGRDSRARSGEPGIRCSK